MRVALVYKRFADTGGSERQVLMLCRALAARGVEVHVFTASVRTAVPPGVRLHRMRGWPRGGLPGLLAFSAWARRAVAREGPFDVSHGFGRTVGQDVYRVGGGCHRTYLDHAHALDRPPWLRSVLRRLPGQRWKARIEERALRSPSTRGVITNSGMTRDDLAFRYDLPPERFAVVPNGTDLERFVPWDEGRRRAGRAELGLMPEHEVVLFLGTGFARKGLEPALRGFARLADARPAARFLVAGRDRRPEPYERLARQLGLDGRVRFLGPRSDPERLYPLADVYTLPTAYDPAANSTLEALACGVPVVTSSMNGAAEILEPGRHGSVVPNPVVPDELATELARWLDVDDRVALRAELRAHAERFPLDDSCDRILELYRAWCAAPTPAPAGGDDA